MSKKIPTDAFRLVKFATNTSSHVGIILFDTGCRLNLISENHPIVEDTEMFVSNNKLKMQGAFGLKKINCHSFVVINIVLKTDKGDKILECIRFEVVPGNISFACIFGMQSIVRFELRLGSKITLRKEEHVVLNYERSSPHLIGPDMSGMRDIYYIDHAMETSKCYVLAVENCEYAVRGNVVSIPRAIKLTSYNIYEDNVRNVDDLTAELFNEIVLNIKNIQSENYPKLPKFELNKISLGKHLTTTQKQKIKHVLIEFREIFSNHSHDIGLVKAREYSVETSTDTPQRAKLFPLSEEAQKIVHEEIKKLVKAKILEKVDNASVITSTFLPIKKNDGSYRLVSDFRSVNSVIVNSNYTIPKISQLLLKMANYKYYIQTDVVKAYWNIKLKKEQRKLFTCYDPITKSTYQYMRMPMGAKSSSHMYQNIAESLLYRNIDEKLWVQYIDDGCLFGNDFDELLVNFRRLLNNYAENGMKLNLLKCKFFVDEVQMCGFRVNKDGIAGDPVKAQSFENLKAPQTKKALHKNLSALNYYRSMVPKFSQYSAPLYQRLKKTVKFLPDEKYIAEWSKLIDQFKNRVTLQRPDFSKPFILQTDASGLATGAVLKQNISGADRIISVYSYKLSPGEMLWETSCRELLGIYKAVVNYKDYLFGRKFLLLTDSRVNCILLTAKMSQVRIDDAVVSPAYRFLLYLSKFSFEVQHSKGENKSFMLCDLLSRCNLDAKHKCLQVTKSMQKPLLFLRDIKSGTLDALKDPELHHVCAIDVENPKITFPTSLDTLRENVRMAQKTSRFVKDRNLWQNNSNFTLVNDHLFFKNKLFVPPHYQKEFLEEIHHHGIGGHHMLNAIHELRVDFPKKFTKINQFLKACDTCLTSMHQRGKHVRDRTKQIVKDINHQLCADIFKFGKVAVLILVDVFSRYIKYRILADETSEQVRDGLMSMILEWGPPLALKTDNGSNFCSRETTELFEVMNIHHTTICPLNSRGNSIAELSIGKIQSELRAMSPNDAEFKTAIALAIYKINIRRAKNSSFCPYEIVHGRNSLYVEQLPELSKSKVATLNESMKKLYNNLDIMKKELLLKQEKELIDLENSICETKPRFRQGDLVKIKITQKLGEKKKTFNPYSRKNYRVIRVLPHCNSALIEETGQSKCQRRSRSRVHMRFLKKVGQVKQLESIDDYIVEINGNEPSSEITPISPGKELELILENPKRNNRNLRNQKRINYAE